MKKFVMVFLALAMLGVNLAYGEGERREVTTVLFDTDKSDIRESEKAKLESAAEEIKADKQVVVISGHADKRASRLYNLDLGQRRANSVKDALLALGVPAELLVIEVSAGEEQPSAPNDSLPEHLQANRRVQIVAAGSEKIVEKVVEVVRKDEKKNRIMLLGGGGPNGIEKTAFSPSHAKAEQYLGPVFGLGYSRKVSDRFSVGIQGFTNNSYFLNVGVDF